ncbi:MAG: SDR family NAD(P)-dependent oxidoreductase [Candidatus Nanopelagicaceae bacterium]
MTNSKVVVVTGANSGIGSAIANHFSENGNHVISLDLKSDSTTLLPSILSLYCDVTEETSVTEAMSKVRNEFGPIDVLIVNAGVVPAWQSTEKIDIADFERVLRINLLGSVITLKAATKHLRSPGASVVMTGSINSWKGDPNIASYVASKHGIAGVVKSSALDLGKRGIRVNAVAPGAVLTDALRKRVLERNNNDASKADAYLAQLAATTTALGRIATIADVVHAVEFLASERSNAITGQLINVDGGVL